MAKFLDNLESVSKESGLHLLLRWCLEKKLKKIRQIEYLTNSLRFWILGVLILICGSFGLIGNILSIICLSNR